MLQAQVTRLGADDDHGLQTVMGLDDCVVYQIFVLTKLVWSESTKLTVEYDTAFCARDDRKTPR